MSYRRFRLSDIRAAVAPVSAGSDERAPEASGDASVDDKPSQVSQLSQGPNREDGGLGHELSQLSQLSQGSEREQSDPEQEVSQLSQLSQRQNSCESVCEPAPADSRLLQPTETATPDGGLRQLRQLRHFRADQQHPSPEPHDCGLQDPDEPLRQLRQLRQFAGEDGLAVGEELAGGTEQDDAVSVLQAWIEGFTSLDPAVPLRGHSARLWQQLIADGHRFLDVWGAEAVRLGWGTLDLFGVHPGAPAARYDVMGLIPMIRGGEVVAIEPTRATTRMPSGGLLTYLRRPQPGAVPIWTWGRT